MARQNENFLGKFSTPKGEAFFPAIVTPDQYDENSSPLYKCDLRLDASTEEAQELMRQADEAADEGYNAAVEAAKTKAAAKKITKMVPYYLEEDEEGEETGNVIFRIRSAATFKDRNGRERSNKIAIFDHRGKPMDLGEDGLGAFSIVRVGGFFRKVVGTMMGSGASMKLQAVKVIEYQAPGGGVSASDFGFDGSEDAEDAEDDPMTEDEENEENEDEEDEGDF